MSSFQVLRRLYTHCGHKGRVWAQAALILLLGGLSVVSSLTLGAVTQSAVGGAPQAALSVFGLYVAVSLAEAGLNWLRTTRLTVLVERVGATFRGYTAQTVLRTRYGDVAGFSAGDLLSRCTQDTGHAAMAGEYVVNLLRCALIPLILLLALTALDWRLALAFLPALAVALLYQRLAEKGSTGMLPWRVALSAMTGETQDLIQHRTTLKAYRLEGQADRWAEEKIEDYRKKGVKGMTRLYLVALPGIFFAMLPLFACAGAGAALVLNGSLSIQGFISALLLAQAASGELTGLPQIFANLPSALASGRRLFELWDLPHEVDGDVVDGIAAAPVVEFRDVTFRYPGMANDDPPVVGHLSFTIRAGERVALVGPSGCGKSTVLKLLSGLYPPESGTVSLWGHPLPQWRRDVLTAKMSLMEQDTFMPDGSIRDNLLCARRDADETQLIAAAEQAGLLPWIMEQEGKWDAPVGEKGCLLSGGLRQRVGLARLFLRAAPLMLLDEATSALDTKTEAGVLAALRQLDKEKTQISVAHRFAAILEADRILVMDGGQLVAEGTHEELLAQNGLYARLYAQWEGGEQDEQET